MITYKGTVRRVEPEDFNEIVNIEKRCFGGKKSYSEKQLSYLINYANSSCFVETYENYIRGFIIVLYRNRSSIASIETLDVDPEFRGLGIGKKLLETAEKEMRAKNIKIVRLEVSIGNLPAINLYEKSGFRKIETLKSYYKYQHFGTHDAFRMIKEL